MNEQLFQFLWKNSLFRPEGLKTTLGEELVVMNPGRLNSNAGPDFLDARIKIGTTVWAGNVELHLKSSDWRKHAHDKDEAYKNIILHVVLEDDFPEALGNFPTLVLKDHIAGDAVMRYSRLMAKPEPIACHNYIKTFSGIKWQSWLHRLLAERWEQRLEEWKELWIACGRDWRQLLYWRMAANFGFHVNRDAFLQLAKSLPLRILSKHRNQLIQLEALIIGQSGLLLVADGLDDDYKISLQKEYNFLRRKYDLEPIPAYIWKFMRMRPSNFPTIRMAQFAALIHQSLDLFSTMMEVSSEKEVTPLLSVTASGYWNNHYRLGVESPQHTPKKLGNDAIRNIITNTIAPMQFLYAQQQGKNNLIERSVELLQSLPPEKNKIMDTWAAINIQAQAAFESQALLQLFNNYCTPRRCLECAVGNNLVQDPTVDYQTI